MDTASESNTKKTFGGPQLKRLSVLIQYKNKPEVVVTGYALTHEILPNQVSFFAAQKFPVDEELNVYYAMNGEKKSVTVTMKSMHEQISSGRVMNSVPTEINPFPARKFYRCYTSVVSADALTATDEHTDTAEGAATEISAAGADAAAVETPAAEATPVMDAAPVAEAPPVAKPAIDPFSADEPVSVPIPDVDELNKAA